MTTREEIFQIQRELGLSDVDMCNYLGILPTELAEYKNKNGTFRPSVFNLMLFIMSVRRPLNSLLPPPHYKLVPIDD